jgi:hypothetical protein
MVSSRMVQTIALLLITALPFVAGASSACAGEVTQQIVDGMIVEGKPNTLQQIQIRLKSFGPGFCGVDLQFLDSHEKIAAPPLVWSRWFPFGGAFNSGSHALGFSEDCDTGAIGEVKYIKAGPESAKAASTIKSDDPECAILKDETQSRDLMNQDQRRWLDLVTRCTTN